MKLDTRSFAIGLLVALTIMGCMMAVTNTNAWPGARYEVHWNGSTYYVVLDTQTGTTVTWRYEPSGETRLFNP